MIDTTYNIFVKAAVDNASVDMKIYGFRRYLYRVSIVNLTTRLNVHLQCNYERISWTPRNILAESPYLH